MRLFKTVFSVFKEGKGTKELLFPFCVPDDGFFNDSVNIY